MVEVRPERENAGVRTALTSAAKLSLLEGKTRAHNPSPSVDAPNVHCAKGLKAALPIRAGCGGGRGRVTRHAMRALSRVAVTLQADGRVMPSFFMRERNVASCTPSCSAAPPWPRIRPRVASNVRRMCDRSASSSVSGLGVDVVDDTDSRGSSTTSDGPVLDQSALDQVPEFADVPVPGMALQALHDHHGDRLDRAAHPLAISRAMDHTSAGISSCRSRSGGIAIGNTLSRK